eukprot:3312431-Alexandrium_andersonii.AAC.1
MQIQQCDPGSWGALARNFARHEGTAHQYDLGVILCLRAASHRVQLPANKLKLLRPRLDNTRYPSLHAASAASSTFTAETASSCTCTAC